MISSLHRSLSAAALALFSVWAHASVAVDETDVQLTFSDISISMTDIKPDDGIDPFVSTGLDSFLSYIKTDPFGNVRIDGKISPGTSVVVTWKSKLTLTLDDYWLEHMDIIGESLCHLTVPGIPGMNCQTLLPMGYIGFVNGDGSNGLITKTFTGSWRLEVTNEGDETGDYMLAYGSMWHFNHRYHEVPAIPEPETNALMLAGLCVTGLLARRRHRRP